MLKDSPRLRLAVRWLLRPAAAIASLLFIAGAGVWWWYGHRAQPSSSDGEIFQGITYERSVNQVPRPNVIHIVTIRLDAPGIGFLVTPGDPNASRPLRARTTSQFLREFKAQVAINGDFFFPWHSTSPWDYYPHIGDPVELEGVAASNGIVYSQGEKRRQYPTLVISRENRCSIETGIAAAYNAVSGIVVLVHNGAVPDALKKRFHDKLDPRTAVGVDRERKHLIFAIVDGRQPGYSEGVTIYELADLLAKHGAAEAINLDGGGSTTLVMQDGAGKPKLLNSPIDNRIPGRERPVANHLGVFAKRNL